LHPETYLNKILIGFSDGDMIIFNIKSKKIVHKFTDFSGETLTSIVGSPDPDIVALGFLNGSITFFELKKAQKLFNLKIDGAVSSLAFRTDELAHFAAGSSRGDVQVFDLESHKLEHIIPMHFKAVSSLFFVPQQPLLVSTSGDNSIKEYLFESSEYRRLRQRSGHYKSPSTVRFFGDDARFLVSAGSDRSIRFSSIFKDNQNFEFSQGPTQKIGSRLKISEEEIKLPEVSGIDIFETKTLKWDNMITYHKNQTFVKTWRFDRKTIGQHSLESSDKSTLTHATISSCGNFGILSTMSGSIEIYNLQSGIKRRTIQAFPGFEIVATFTNSTNTQLISISKNGCMYSFDFSKGSILNTIDLGYEVVNAEINKDTELIAVACSDFVIRVFDFSAMRLVRLFNGHSACIKDLIFSSDSKWLISCSQDKTIRTWDMTSGNIADVLEVENVPTNIALSRNLEFLASCHENEISISIWSNRSLYAGDCNIIESAIIWSQSKSTECQDSQEVEYSEFPVSRWKNIYFLEKIRFNTKPNQLSSNKRNALPFFLSQVLEHDKITSESELAISTDEPIVSDRQFSDLIENYCSSLESRECFDYLKYLHPSKLDFEISCLSTENKLDNIIFILKTLKQAIDNGSDFEIAHAILSLTLRHHELYISQHRSSFVEVMRGLANSIQNKWYPLEDLMQSTICLISFSRDQ
jgi:U3 small nucleolar RNA-associated protein 21